MKVRLRVRRENPETDEAPHWAEYVVDVEATDRVLDALIQVQARLDPTLGLRYSCGHGVCGSDAMVINSHSALACKTLIRDAVRSDAEGAGAEPPTITVEPLAHLPVLRDLIVDQGPFFARYRAVTPYLLPQGSEPKGERLQTPEQRAEIADPMNCILCAACVSACPVMGERPAFLGPAAIVQAARFVWDSRDMGLAPRRPALDDPDGVWPCESRFECTRACPRGIKVTRLINLTKRRLRPAGA